MKTDHSLNDTVYRAISFSEEIHIDKLMKLPAGYYMRLQNPFLIIYTEKIGFFATTFIYLCREKRRYLKCNIIFIK